MATKSSADTMIKNVVAICGAAAGLIAAVVPAISAIKKEAIPKDLVEVPEVYSKKCPLDLDAATRVLERKDFQVTPVPIRKASIKYRDYFPSQIIGTTPRQKKKVERGSPIILYYVEDEVIEQSQKLFQEREARRANVELEKTRRKLVGEKPDKP